MKQKNLASAGMLIKGFSVCFHIMNLLNRDSFLSLHLTCFYVKRDNYLIFVRHLNGIGCSYMGTITGISDMDPVRWPNSHWRSVKVCHMSKFPTCS